MACAPCSAPLRKRRSSWRPRQNPAEARRLTAELRPDIVLVDVRMKAMSGFELCEHLLRADPDVKVVLLTVYDDEQYLFQGLRAGAAGYLTKQVVAEICLFTSAASSREKSWWIPRSPAGSPSQPPVSTVVSSGREPTSASASGKARCWS